MLFEIFAIVGELRQLLDFDVVQRVGERHVAEAVMMAVAFAVGGDMDELRPVARRPEMRRPACSAKFSPLESNPSKATAREIGPS